MVTVTCPDCDGKSTYPNSVCGSATKCLHCDTILAVASRPHRPVDPDEDEDDDEPETVRVVFGGTKIGFGEMLIFGIVMGFLLLWLLGSLMGK